MTPYEIKISGREMGELSGNKNIVTLGHNSTHSLFDRSTISWNLQGFYTASILIMFECANRIGIPITEYVFA